MRNVLDSFGFLLPYSSCITERLYSQGILTKRGNLNDEGTVLAISTQRIISITA